MQKQSTNLIVDVFDPEDNAVDCICFRDSFRSLEQRDEPQQILSFQNCPALERTKCYTYILTGLLILSFLLILS